MRPTPPKSYSPSVMSIATKTRERVSDIQLMSVHANITDTNCQFSLAKKNFQITNCLSA